MTTRGKTQTGNSLEHKGHVSHQNLSFLLHAKSNRVVSLMRNNVQLELKYEEDGGGLDESKEEETPLQQLAKVIEKNGI